MLFLLSKKSLMYMYMFMYMSHFVRRAYARAREQGTGGRDHPTHLYRCGVYGEFDHRQKNTLWTDKITRRDKKSILGANLELRRAL